MRREFDWMDVLMSWLFGAVCGGWVYYFTIPNCQMPASPPTPVPSHREAPIQKKEEVSPWRHM